MENEKHFCLQRSISDLLVWQVQAVMEKSSLVLWEAMSEENEQNQLSGRRGNFVDMVAIQDQRDGL